MMCPLSSHLKHGIIVPCDQVSGALAIGLGTGAVGINAEDSKAHVS